MRDLSVKKLTMAGVMAALVFVMTYVPKVPVPMTGGYVHLGDGAIFLSALLLGPLGVPAAAIGSGLSDILGGSMVYVLPTMAIKALVALIAWKVWKEGSWLRAVLAFVLAEAAMVAGYFAFEAVMYGAAAAWAAVGPNCLQGVAGVMLGLVCHALYPRMKRLIR
ncbi:MAG: ECF transporter S component [Clostridia bacterium]|nr:ECF transporter S component [Clostridia bacterium]